MRRFTTSITCKEIFGGVLLLIFSTVCVADQSAAAARAINAAANLMETDLVKKKDLLDCQLRLEGTAPNYKLVYSLGEIPIPVLSVQAIYDGVFALISVNAQISGLPVYELFIPYVAVSKSPYIPIGTTSIMDGVFFKSTGHYDITVKMPENRVLTVLRERYQKNQVVDRSEWGDLAPGAVMLRSHPEPKLFLAAMDGFSGAKNTAHTKIYYVCLADR